MSGADCLRPIAWRIDSSKSHHFTLYDERQVPFWEARSQVDRDVKITPMYGPIPAGFCVLPEEPTSEMIHAGGRALGVYIKSRIADGTAASMPKLRIGYHVDWKTKMTIRYKAIVSAARQSASSSAPTSRKNSKHPK